MQIESAEVNDRKRFVSIIAAVLSPVCAPLCDVVNAWLDFDDPTRVLRMIVDITTKDEARQFATDMIVERMLKPDVAEALQALDVAQPSAKRSYVRDHEVPPEIAKMLSLAPLNEEDDDDRDDEEDDDDGEDKMPVLEEHIPELAAPRLELYQVVRNVIRKKKYERRVQAPIIQTSTSAPQ